jgi:hypothetical protein
MFSLSIVLFADFVDLLEQAFDALAYSVPLAIEAGQLLFEVSDVRRLFLYACVEAGSMLLNRKAQLALALEHFHGAEYSLFKSLEVISGHGCLGGMFCDSRHLNLLHKSGIAY